MDAKLSLYHTVSDQEGNESAFMNACLKLRHFSSREPEAILKLTNWEVLESP